MPIFSRNDAKECSVDAFPVLQRVKISNFSRMMKIFEG